MHSRSSQLNPIAIAESEAYQALLARARRKKGGVPAKAIVRHVLLVTRGADWPIQRDALEAVLRRCASTHTDEIQIVGRPARQLLGLYSTRRSGSNARPYRTRLRRIEPVDGSCDCADFLRSSLGCASTLSPSSRTWPRKRRVDLEREGFP